MLLLNFRHRPQQHEADCLVACTAMVLDYLGIIRSDKWLSKVLKTTEIGTPFSNIEKLASRLGLKVESKRHGVFADFEHFLEVGLPIIVAVDSDDPNYWPHYHNHAVVVVGFNADEVYVNDPAMSDAPQIIPMNTFLWAWSLRDNEYGVIRLV